MVAKVLGKTEAPIKSWVMMYKACFFIYWSEILVVTNAVMAVLEGFHQRIARRISGMTSRRVDGRGWGWYSVDVELRVTGLWQRR